MIPGIGAGASPNFHKSAKKITLSAGFCKWLMGFRQFLLRGIDKVRGEWRLVTIAWNLKRMFVLCP